MSSIQGIEEAGSGSRRMPAWPEGAEPRRERCPRCSSHDTKFCYYNNYNTAQPRHFCKSCRRYWTLGGSLRNVPVGGSTRKRLRPNPVPDPKPSATFVISSAPASLPVSAAPSPVTAMAHAVDVTGHGGFGSIMMDAGFGMGLGEMMPGGRTGFGLGLGLGVGGAPLLWHRTLLEEEVIGDTWRIDGENGACFGATEAGGESWKDVGLTSPVDSCDGVLERKA